MKDELGIDIDEITKIMLIHISNMTKEEIIDLHERAQQMEFPQESYVHLYDE